MCWRYWRRGVTMELSHVKEALAFPLPWLILLLPPRRSQPQIQRHPALAGEVETL